MTTVCEHSILLSCHIIALHDCLGRPTTRTMQLLVKPIVFRDARIQHLFLEFVLQPRGTRYPGSARNNNRKTLTQSNAKLQHHPLLTSDWRVALEPQPWVTPSRWPWNCSAAAHVFSPVETVYSHSLPRSNDCNFVCFANRTTRLLGFEADGFNETF